MIMRNSKIKALFEKAEEQIQVDEIRKQETYNMMPVSYTHLVQSDETV